MKPTSNKFVSACAKLYNIFRMGSNTLCQAPRMDIMCCPQNMDQYKYEDHSNYSIASLVPYVRPVMSLYGNESTWDINRN